MVTDSEAESLASGRSIEDNAKARLWGAFAGKPLTPELRDSMLISSQKSMQARLEAQQDVDKQYRPMFEAFGAEMPTPITPEHLKELDVTHGVANFSHSKVFEGAPIKDILEYEFDDALRSPGEITRWWRSLSREQKQEAVNLDYWTYILSELKRAKEQRAEIDQIDQIDQVDGGAS